MDNYSGIQLISIHIPKTAGRSFHRILCDVYGERYVLNVLRKDYEIPGRRVSELVTPEMRVIHGHFRYSDIRDIVEGGNFPIVTWLRDPVERVISNYYFFIRRVRSGAVPQSMHRSEETLLDYARLEGSRNRMAEFLRGLALEDIYFIGITEHFSEDVRYLADMLGWGDVNPVHLNSNREYREKHGEIDELTRTEIERLNQEDMRIYSEALRLRKRRLTRKVRS